MRKVRMRSPRQLQKRIKQAIVIKIEEIIVRFSKIFTHNPMYNFLISCRVPFLNIVYLVAHLAYYTS